MTHAARRCATLVLAVGLGASAPDTAAGQQGPPTARPRADERPIGAFRDIEELSLADLLDRRVSIASAGRVQRIEEAPSVVSVITDEDIRRMGARTVSDVLRTVPGFDVTARSIGSDEMVVRGKRPYEDSDVLILVNGQRLNDAVTNQVMYFNRSLPLGNVRQIEVVRGPGSAVYGAYAFGGVVNIVTHTPQTLSGVQASAQAGSFGSARASVTTGHAWGALSLGSSFEMSVTDGPRLHVAADAQTLIDRMGYAPVGLPPVSLAPRQTRDAVRSMDARLSAEYHGTTLNVSARGDRMRGGYLGLLDILPADDDHRTQSVGADVNHRLALGARGGLRLSGAFVQNVFDAHHTAIPAGFVHQFADGVLVRFPTDGILEFTYANRRAEGNAVLDFAFSRADQLVVGVGFQREASYDERASSNYDFVNRVSRPDVAPIDPLIPHVARTIASVFAQESWNPVPALGVTAGIRHDRYSDFGSTTNPRFGVVWRLPNAWYAKALYGRAFKAPTFEQLRQYVPTVRRGDPTLRPATIETRELAAGWARGGTRLGANYFAETVRDRFIPAFGTTESIIAGNEFTFANGSPLRTRGVEGEVRQSIGLDHALFGAYTYQAARVVGAAERVHEVPTVLFNAGGTLGITRQLSATLVLLHRGAVERASADYRRDGQVAELLQLPLRARVPAHTVANLNVRLLNVWDTFELAATVNNLFGARYVDPSLATGAPLDYPQPGRAAYLKVGYRF
jgi:outer membrane receptor for ferrienterochelin and colicin